MVCSYLELSINPLIFYVKDVIISMYLNRRTNIGKTFIMKMYLLGIDVGTTNVKALLLTEDGKVVAKSQPQGSITTHSPYVNWAEHDANLWWESTCDAISQIIGTLNLRDDHIVGIAISSHGSAMLPLDENGNPLRRALIWMDRRSTEECRFLESYFGKERYKELFGALADPSFQMPKLLWFKNHEPDLFKKTKKVLMAGAYVNYKLTSVMSIDNLQARISQAYDNVKNEWSKELEEITQIPIHDLMPEIYSPFAIIGGVTREAAQKTGLEEGIPVVCCGSDGMAARLEVGLTKIGDAAEITGTSSNIYFTFDKTVPENGRLFPMEPMIVSKEVPTLLFGAINNTGGSLKWFANTLGYEENEAAKFAGHNNVYQIMDEMAESAPAGSRGLIYFPYLLGERAPLWNDYVKGMFIGLTSGSTKQQIVRSLMEGTSFALRHVSNEAVNMGAQIKRFRVSGGCANSDIWLKIKASMLKTPMLASTSSGGAAFGDAIIAGYGIGLYKDFVQTVERFQHIDKEIEPVEEWIKVYDDLYELFISMREHLDNDLYNLNEVAKRNNM
jgi:xylulokinase